MLLWDLLHSPTLTSFPMNNCLFGWRLSEFQWMNVRHYYLIWRRALCTSILTQCIEITAGHLRLSFCFGYFLVDSAKDIHEVCTGFPKKRQSRQIAGVAEAGNYQGHSIDTYLRQKDALRVDNLISSIRTLADGEEVWIYNRSTCVVLFVPSHRIWLRDSLSTEKMFPTSSDVHLILFLSSKLSLLHEFEFAKSHNPWLCVMFVFSFDIGQALGLCNGLYERQVESSKLLIGIEHTSVKWSEKTASWWSYRVSSMVHHLASCNRFRRCSFERIQWRS